MEVNSTGGQGSRRAVAPSDDDDDVYKYKGKMPHGIIRKLIHFVFCTLTFKLPACRPNSSEVSLSHKRL